MGGSIPLHPTKVYGSVVKSESHRSPKPKYREHSLAGLPINYALFMVDRGSKCSRESVKLLRREHYPLFTPILQGDRVLQEARSDRAVLSGHVLAKPVWSSDPPSLIRTREAGALPAAGTNHVC